MPISDYYLKNVELVAWVKDGSCSSFLVDPHIISSSSFYGKHWAWKSRVAMVNVFTCEFPILHWECIINSVWIYSVKSVDLLFIVFSVVNHHIGLTDCIWHLNIKLRRFKWHAKVEWVLFTIKPTCLDRPEIKLWSLNWQSTIFGLVIKCQLCKIGRLIDVDVCEWDWSEVSRVKELDHDDTDWAGEAIDDALIGRYVTQTVSAFAPSCCGLVLWGARVHIDLLAQWCRTC